MTTGPLDQTEDWARLAFARGDLLQAELEDVLALVEVARAARALQDVESAYTWGQLDAALARLDGKEPA